MALDMHHSEINVPSKPSFKQLGDGSAFSDLGPARARPVLSQRLGWNRTHSWTS